MHLVETPKSPRLWQPTKDLVGSLRVDTELAIPVLKLRPGNQIKGEKINDLSPLPPEAHFRRVMLDGARIFVQRMAVRRERYHLKTPESDMRIWGPVQWVDRSQEQGAYAADEWLNPEYLDFKIVGDFVAEFGFLMEQFNDEGNDLVKKIVQANAVTVWSQTERAAERRELRRRGSRGS